MDHTKKGKIGGTLIFAITRPLAILPLSWQRTLGRFLGWLAGDVIGYRRDVVITNLSRAFPEKQYHEISDICRRFYRHFGKVFTEALWFGGHSNPRTLHKSHIVEMKNVSLLNELYDKGKSIFVMASHNGNWELYGGYISYAYEEKLKCPENDFCVIYKKMSSRTFEQFMTRNRIAPIVDKDNFDGMVETDLALRYCLKHRQDKKIYTFITDQYPYSDRSKVKIESFLNQPTYSMDGAPALAHKLGMAVVYLNMREKEDGNYEMELTRICEDASQMSVSEILTQYYRLLEEDIKAQPWNYLWTHKRWK